MHLTDYMATLIKIHLIGSAVAVLMQLLITAIYNHKRQRSKVWDFISVVARTAENHGLILDFDRAAIISLKRNEGIAISNTWASSRIEIINLIIQSMVLGWINVLVCCVSLYFTVILSIDSLVPSKDLLEIESKTKKFLKNEYTLEQLIGEVYQLAIDNVHDIRHRVDIRGFVEDHLQSTHRSSNPSFKNA